MEKIILEDGRELTIIDITGSSGVLEISFEDKGFEEIEDIFMTRSILENIRLVDENNTILNTYKNYTILQQIIKKKDTPLDATESGRDIIKVILNQEPYFVREIKKLQEQIALHEGGIKELGQIVGLHDGAIEELGGLVGELSEGGEEL